MLGVRSFKPVPEPPVRALRVLANTVSSDKCASEWTSEVSDVDE